MDYSNKTAKIYKLNFPNNYYYIGSTIQTLKKRFSGHKLNYNKKQKINDITTKLHKKIREVGWEHINIELVEEFNYSNKSEILKKENLYLYNCINDTLCLNMILSYNDNNKNNKIQKKGKIYKLICNDGYFYIGSTIKTLNERFLAHKYFSKKENTKLYNHINILGWNNIKIILLEEIDNIDNLFIKEKEYIVKEYSELCLNTTSILSEQEIKDNKTLLDKDYRNKNKEKITEVNAIYRDNNKDKIQQINKEYRDNNKHKRKEYCTNNKDKIDTKRKKYCAKNKDKIQKRIKEYCSINKDKLCEYKKNYRKNNYEKCKEKTREYYNKNKDIINEKRRHYRKKKREQDTKQE